MRRRLEKSLVAGLAVAIVVLVAQPMIAAEGASSDSIRIDADFPGGNIVLERITGDDVYLRQDLRDTEGWWFYWYFRVRGAAGRRLTFHWTNQNVLGTQGPAVSTDQGRSWAWLGPQSKEDGSFAYAFPAAIDEVRFCFAMPYVESNLREFLQRYQDHPHLKVERHATTRGGRTNERLRLGRVDGGADHRVLVTCRHHACEMMASWALEGLLEAVLADTEDGRWYRDRVELLVVPFMDKDGVEQGDQGKNRRPHDHNRDYVDTSLYPSVAALRQFVPEWSQGRLRAAIDLHCPWIRGGGDERGSNERIVFVGIPPGEAWRRLEGFARLFDEVQQGPLVHAARHDLPWGEKWNTLKEPRSFARWAGALPGTPLAWTVEVPYANVADRTVTIESARAIGRDLGRALRRYLEEPRTIEPLARAVDLKIGESRDVRLYDDQTVRVKLVGVKERRDQVRRALREVRVAVEVDGEAVELSSATYHLPVSVGKVQIDCPITKGYLEGGDHWGLKADARLRLWPAGSPWIRPGTFAYPVHQRWLASHTLMSNELGDSEEANDQSYYYHWGLDIGGPERMLDVLAATDAKVISAGEAVLPGAQLPSPVRPRYDVIYLQDARGWYYRYSHLDSIDPAVKPGAGVRQGQRIGVLGKRGASGGWSHLHFDIVGLQPSGRWGVIDGYAFLWEAYQRQWPSELEAVARPRQLAWVGEPVVLDGSRSWCRRGKEHIVRYEWALSDGTTAEGAKAEHRYERTGAYSEILKVTDDRGHVDYDFARVQVVQREHPLQQAPSVHAAFWPTFGLKPGAEVTFKARSFRVDRKDGCEEWGFGDGSPMVRTQSNSSGDALAEDGYAVTTHRYVQPGSYLVTVRRTNSRGETGTAHLHVLVE